MNCMVLNGAIGDRPPTVMQHRQQAGELTDQPPPHFACNNKPQAEGLFNRPAIRDQWRKT